MPQIQDNAGIPTTSPQIGAPDDLQHIQASPESFGGSIAQGEQRLGAGLHQAGQFFGQVAVDDASNGFQDAATKLLRGDPNNMVPGSDGTPQPDTGYLGKKGRAALDARPEVESQLDKLIEDTRANLQTPEQQLQFDSISRRYRSSLGTSIAAHADQQAFSWYTEVNKATEDNALAHIAANADNQDEVNHATADLMRARIKQVQLSSGGAQGADVDAVVNQAVSQARREAIKAQVEAISVRDPVRAMDVLDRSKDLAGPLYQPLAAQLRTRVNQQTGIQAGQQAITEASTVAAKPDARTNINDAILDQESGNNPAVAASVNGAIGPGQIMPATFAQYAKPGEDIANPADNRTVANRIIDDLKQKYPDDPARVAVGYFSGPGNVAPAGSATPWINDAKDGNGKSVSSYVGDVTGRLSGGAAAGPVGMKASAYQRVMALTADNPEAQKVALAYVNEQYTAAQVASLADQKARKDASDGAANGYVGRLLQNQTDGIVPQIAADPHLDWETKIRLGELAEHHLKSDIDGAVKTYGTGFWDAYTRVHLPQGDPNRITDQNQIFTRAGPGGDLTLSGVKELNAMIAEKDTAQGEADSTLQKLFFDNAKRQISGDDPLLHIKDPKGEENFLKFMQHALPAFQAGRAAGKSIAELTDMDSPIGKAIAGYKRTPQQYMADMMQGDVAGPAAAAAERTLQDVIRDVQGGKLDQAAGKAEALRNGWIKPDPAKVE